MPFVRIHFLSPLVLLIVLAIPPLGHAQTAPPQDKQGPAVSPKLDRLGDPLPPGAVARLGTTRFRHEGAARIIGYSADGNLLSTSGNTTLHFWEPRTGKEVRRLALKKTTRPGFGRPDVGPSVLVSGDGKIIITGVDGGDCTVVDAATGKTLRAFKIPQGERQVGGPGDSGMQTILSHDGRLLAIPERNRPTGGAKIQLWDTATGNLLRDVSPREKGAIFTAAALSPDGKALLAVEASDPEGDKGDKMPAPRFRFWDPTTGMELRSFDAPMELITKIQLTPDGKALAVTGSDGQTVRVLDAATGKELHRLAGRQNRVDMMFFSDDNKTLFVVDNAQVTHWDVRTGKELRTFPLTGGTDGKSNDRVQFFGGVVRSSAALSRDGRTLALPALVSVALWDVQSGKELTADEGHRDRIDSVVFGPQGGLVLTGSADGSLYLWEAGSGKRVREFVRKPSPQDEEGPRRGREMFDLFRVRGTFAPDGKSVAGLWWGGKLHVWDTATGKLRHHLDGGSGNISFAYSPDGRFLAANGQDGAVTLWDQATGRKIRQFDPAPKPGPDAEKFGPGAEPSIYSTAFSLDGRVLLRGAMIVEPNGLKVLVNGWELASGRERLRFETGILIEDEMGRSFETIATALDAFIVSFLFSPDGKLLAEVGFSSIKLRDLNSGEEVRVLGGRQVSAATAAFSPDGNFLLAGRQDGSIRVWDVTTGTVLLDFPAHPTAVTALAFSPDGKLVASGSRDTSTILWDWEHIRRSAKTRKPPAAQVKQEALWAVLAREDAAEADRAIKALASAPAETVAFLRPRLRPVAPVDPAHLERLLADLENKQFAKRQQAEQELEKLGDLAVKAIRDRSAASPSLEMGRRLERLMEKLDATPVPLETLQTLRAVEVLERVGTPAAGQLLAELAGGAAGHRVTEEARLSLQRLTKRAAPY